MIDEFDPPICPPRLLEGNNFDLNVESTLESLSLYDFQVASNCPGIQVAQMFEKYPLVPGVIVVEEQSHQNPQFLGMISRQQLLEYLIRPQGLELFLQQPLQVLYSYARTPLLILHQDTPILTAAQRAMRRGPEFRGEPIVVQTNSEESQTNLPYRLLNIHELNLAYWQIRGIETQVRYERMQIQMVQTEKMASLGRLVDGIAHEILDPVGFIWGNLAHLTTYSESLLELISAYEDYLSPIPLEIEQLKEDLEFDFLQQDISQIVGSIKSGADRLKKLATSLQNFCYIDEVHPKPTDIHSCINSILLLLKSRISSEIKVVKNYGNLPPLLCYVGQINQVFMNIITNAVDALIGEACSQEWAPELRLKNPSKKTPTIEITTEVRSVTQAHNLEVRQQRWILIQIADNGPGMSLEKQQKILESFSTRKRMEKETSLGVSYHIITAKHGGQFLMNSEWGEGTEFRILLPLV